MLIFPSFFLQNAFIDLPRSLRLFIELFMDQPTLKKISIRRKSIKECQKIGTEEKILQK